jgi:hypothetical protein
VGGGHHSPQHQHDDQVNRTPTMRVLDRLDGVRRSGNGWTARCPGHEDRNASLSVNERSDGSALVHCFAGCKVVDLLQSIGLCTKDLFVDGFKPMTRSSAPKTATANDIIKVELLGKVTDRVLPIAITVGDEYTSGRIDPSGPGSWVELAEYFEDRGVAEMASVISGIARALRSAEQIVGEQVPGALVTAAELEHMQIAEPRYAVPGLLVAGLCMLASKPKVGKSWLALDVAIAAASGGKALGVIDIPEAGDVLYLALEDTKRRLQTRMRRLLIEKFPPRLSFALDWPKLDDGGVTQLDEWLARHPKARLVVVDVWKRVRQARRKGADPYSEDYEHLVELKTLADHFDVTILVVHHTRKAEAADVLDEVNATTGASGACDSILVLHRSRTAADAELWIIGRDLEDGHKALSFDKGRWTLLGESKDVTRSKERQEILDAVNAVNGGRTSAEIAEVLGKARTATKALIWKMVADGELVRLSNTKYAAAFTVSSGTDVTGVYPFTRDPGDAVNGKRSSTDAPSEPGVEVLDP